MRRGDVGQVMSDETCRGSPFGPYSINSDLPPSIQRRLPHHAQAVFREAYNRCLQEHQDVEHARRKAWAAVKRGYQTKPDGNWVTRTGDPETAWSLAQRPGLRRVL
jgi:cation transport regulator